MSTRAPLRSDDAPQQIDATLHAWISQPVAQTYGATLEHVHEPDEVGNYHWLVRLKGEEKDVVTVWFSLRQRTVYVECELMPAPESNKEDLYAYLLSKNADMREVHLALGPEKGVYLVTQVPYGELSLDRVDELLGAIVVYVDELFSTAMSLGFQGLYRRRKRSIH